MKYLLTTFFLLISFLAFAQIVNIPDANFKQALRDANIDTNADGEIQTGEAAVVTSLYVSNRHIADLTGIEAFTNLVELMCDQNDLTYLDISSLPNLFSVVCENNRNLQELIAEGAPKLHYLNCGWSGGFNGSTYVNLKNCDSLVQLYTDYLNAETLDISGSTRIQNVTDFQYVSNFIARGCTGLQNLNSGVGGVNNLLDLTGCINLQTISFLESNIEIMDLSPCINLSHVTILQSVHGPKNINIKNGNFTTVSINANDNQINNLNICADDFEVDTVAHLLWNYPGTVNVSSYCSFFPGGSYNTIKGKVRLDLDNNGCNNADAGMGQVPIRITDNNGNAVVRYTAPSGDYAHYPYAGTFTLNPYFPYSYFNIAPAATTIVFDTANSLIDSASFCITPNGVHNDLEITFLPLGGARPGFGAGYQLVYKNRGTTTLSGSVQLNFDNAKLAFASAVPNITSQSAGQLTWNYNNLLPFQNKIITVSFDVFPPPANNINDTIIYLATINPVANDETPADNSFILPQRIIASYDPNDKQCLEGNKIGLADIDKYLHYIIHFQNLGTDTAFHVVVADQLSDKLDWNSVELISSSHPCDVREKNGKLEFVFQNIHLPYATIDEPGSHGFVAFKLKPKNNIIIGDSLNNKAGIYFDFNLPVITNLASTVVSASSPVPVKLEYFSVTKKNESHLLTWKAQSTDGSTNFIIERSGDGIHFSNIGNITETSERCELPFYLTDDKPLSGKNYYRLKITDADEKYFYSKILVIGNNKAGLEIIAVTGDADNTNIYFNSAKQQIIQMKLLAADGKIIYNSNKELLPGSSIINLPIRNVAKGIYTLMLYTNEGDMIIKRFIK